MSRLIQYLLLSWSIFLPVFRMDAQVYGYDPVRYTNFETNPAYLATSKYSNTASLLHTGNIPFYKGFAYDELRLSAYNSKFCYGSGLVLNHTQINDSTSYSYAGAGLAYRTILFNSLHLRLGALYKFNAVHAGGGTFGYYNFTPASPEKTQTTTIQNANLSVSFSSPGDQYFLSFSMLNANLQAGNRSVSFPAYYAVSAGDLLKILLHDPRSNYELYYTGVLQFYSSQPSTISHSINFSSALSITREASIKFGLRAGYVNHSCLQLMPALSYYHVNYRRSRRYADHFRIKNFWNYQLGCDIGQSLISRKNPYHPTLQISVTRIL